MKTITFTLLFFILPVWVFADESTSPNSQLSKETETSVMSQLQKVLNELDASDVITFSEFPIGTSINSQYQDIGVIFDGSGPFITSDGANPTSPVLSGTPRFQGDIIGTFVEPGTNHAVVVQSFTFHAGYFDEFGSTRVEWFDPNGEKLGQKINSQLGIEQLTIEGGNIASWKIGIVQDEPAGYAIDNVFFIPVGPSVLFREVSDGNEDGSWGFLNGEIPGFDHVGFQMGNIVYESHPGYETGIYASSDREELVIIDSDGVQSQHSRATFKHYSTNPDSTPVTNFEEIPIEEKLADDMRTAIKSVQGSPFQPILYSDIDEIEATLSPAAQKGGGGSFTCVGLIEWSAEQAGYNGGEGFIKNVFESFFTGAKTDTSPPELIEIPLLSPQLLNYAMKTQLLQDPKQWFQGLFDPVDFIIKDPLGRKLGFTQDIGFINEIPNSFYSGNGEIEQFLVPNAIPGFYTIKLVGTNADMFMAIGDSETSESLRESLAQDETKIQRFFVTPKAGTGGDVNNDGNVNNDDVQALIPRLNHFTDGLGDPGDLDGDGLLSNADLTLLKKLVESLEIKLTSFEAAVEVNYGVERVSFEWKTTEDNNAQMNIWCAQKEKNEFKNLVRINEKKIHSKTGGFYRELVTYSRRYPVKESGLKPGINYCVLEDIDYSGIHTVHCDHMDAIVLNSKEDIQHVDLKGAKSLCKTLVE